jgi:hypothetical protein
MVNRDDLYVNDIGVHGSPLQSGIVIRFGDQARKKEY